MRDRADGAPLYAAGVSLGGNALAKWLGERGDEARAHRRSAPRWSARRSTSWRRETRSEQGFSLAVREALPRDAQEAARSRSSSASRASTTATRSRASRTLRDFDNVVTAPLHGFRDTDDYWTRASSKPWLAAIRVPTLIVNARDDPFLPDAALPTDDEVSPAVTLEFTQRGGHVGFVFGPFPGNIDWLPRRILHFFEHRE